MLLGGPGLTSLLMRHTHPSSVQVDPALAFKLELSRLSNYDVTLCKTSNARIHLYYARSKMATTGGEVTDRRFFIRTVMRSPEKTAFSGGADDMDYFHSLGESQLLEALDELEVAMANPLSVLRMCVGVCVCVCVCVNYLPFACMRE